MYSTSEQFKQIIGSGGYESQVVGTVTFKDGTTRLINNSNVLKGSLYINSQCVDGNDFSLGAVYANELGLGLFLDNDIQSYDDAVIDCRFGLAVSDTEIEYVPLGIYTIIEPSIAGNVINIKALDNMILLDESIDGVGTSGSLYALTLYCCERCGVTFGMTAEELELYPNGKQHYILPSDCPVETCRDLISYVAQLLGCYACCNRAGELVYRSFNPYSVSTLNGSHRSNTTVSNFVVTYNGIQMDVGESTYIRVDDQKLEGTTLILETNPLLQNRTTADIESALDDLLLNITPVSFMPYECDYTGDPSLDAGDCVTLSGGRLSQDVVSMISSSNWRYRGKHRLKAVGRNPKLKVKESQSTKRLNQTSALAQSSRETVYYFENASREVIKEQEEIIIEIQFAAVKKASPMFHATAQLELEQPGTVLFRYIIDNTPFEFTPQFQLPQGVSTVQLFYPLNGMSENKLHTFEVCVSSANTTGFIPKKAIQAVVVGQGLGSGEAMWDGRIRVSEEVMPFGLGNTISMQFTATATGTTEIPIPNGFTVPISPFKLGNGFAFGGFTEIVEMNIEEETGE